jgi:hypothetical protein
MNAIDTVITDLEMLKNGSWIPDKDSCEASIRMLERAKTEFDRMYSEEEVRKSLLEIALVNPAHISLLKSGYGQFPDTYELTKKGVDYIVEQFKKK